VAIWVLGQENMFEYRRIEIKNLKWMNPPLELMQENFLLDLGMMDTGPGFFFFGLVNLFECLGPWKWIQFRDKG
jgi:hypothetical protein